jgi:signal peptidase I
MRDRKGRPRAALHFHARRSAVGYIPLENVVGRVGMIFFSLDAGGNGTPPAIRYERIETVVQ